jgi:hypothetical protein
VNNQIRLKAPLVPSACKHRECHPVVTPNVVHLSPFSEVTHHDLVVLQANPYKTYLWPTVRIDGRQMDQGSRLEHRFHIITHR